MSIHLIENIFMGLAMKSILKLFSDHGTFVQPDALKYISLKENPDDFASFLISSLREYPLFLTVDVIKDLETAPPQLTQTPVPIPTVPQPSPPLPLEKTIEKELQKKMLSKIYSSRSFSKEVNEEEDEEGDEDEKPEEEIEEKKPAQPLEIKTVKGWKPLAKDYDAEVQDH